MKNPAQFICAMIVFAAGGVLPAQSQQPDSQAGLPLPLPSFVTDRPSAPLPSPTVASPAAPTAEPPSPALKENPLNTLRAFEPAADSEYHLGRGDAITIDFSGRPELQAKLVVGPDGRITLPLVGDVLLDGLTRPEAGKAIETAMSAYYSNMTVQVSVTQYTSNRVLVLGAVEHPGVLTFEGQPKLLEALTRAGMMQKDTTRSGQLPEQCAIYRGNDKVAWVDVRSLIETGNALANMRLQRDDIVYVPSAQERFVSILGEVQHPGAVSLMHNSTVASVLAEVGGITDHAGNNPRLTVVDPASGTSQEIKYADLMNPAKSLEIKLKPGQIIYVPRSGFFKATYVLERLTPMVNVMTMMAYAGIL